MANKQLTPLGRQLRKLRIDRGENLRDMGGKLGISAAYLSAIETGRKNAPDGIADKISILYALPPRDGHELSHAERISRQSFNIKPQTDGARETVAVLARSLDGLSDAELMRIREIAAGSKGSKR